MSVADNLTRIQESIGAFPVKLIAVTKYADIEAMQEAFNCGVSEFGESKVQDALEKQELLSGELAGKVNWHLIGHLQSNKVRKAVGRFALIHSVDSFNLAGEISKAAEKLSLVQPVLLQVKMLPDANKSGFQPEELLSGLHTILALAGLKVEGLMTIAPLTEDPRVWRQCFTGLAALRDQLNLKFGVALKELSMGMSQDFREALGCGATMVRLGRAVFGNQA